MKRVFFFSRHYRKDKYIDTSLAIDCICTGEKEFDKLPDKFRSSKTYRKGELVVVWKDRGEKCFVITAYWKK